MYLVHVHVRIYMYHNMYVCGIGASYLGRALRHRGSGSATSASPPAAASWGSAEGGVSQSLAARYRACKKLQWRRRLRVLMPRGTAIGAPGGAKLRKAIQQIT